MISNFPLRQIMPLWKCLMRILVNFFTQINYYPVSLEPEIL